MNVAFTAQDRKKALSLKSHVRVISSHQPVRLSEFNGDKRSSYDSSKSQTPGQSSSESSGPSGIESSLLTDNFKELLLEPVDVQLLKLLGPDAEDFLHPTFRDGAKKTLNPIAVQRKCKYACVFCACGLCAQSCVFAASCNTGGEMLAKELFSSNISNTKERVLPQFHAISRLFISSAKIDR